MLFKKKEKERQEDQQPRVDEIAPPVPVDGESGSQAKDLKPAAQTDIIYPTGLKLALLMVAIFIGMFLVTLVNSS